MDKDSKGQRKLEDCRRGLLLAVEGRSLEQKLGSWILVFNAQPTGTVISA